MLYKADCEFVKAQLQFPNLRPFLAFISYCALHKLDDLSSTPRFESQKSALEVCFSYT